METIDLKGLVLSEIRRKWIGWQWFYNESSTSTWLGYRRNVFTQFNTLNFVIAVALAVQAWSNTIFFAVIRFNAITGIDRMRAKRIDKLNLMSRELVTVETEKKMRFHQKRNCSGWFNALSSGEQIPYWCRSHVCIAENQWGYASTIEWSSLKKLAMNFFQVVIAVVKSLPVSSELEQTAMPTSWWWKLKLKPINSRILYNLAKIF